jgi:ParB-like nuclease domain
MSTPSPVGAPTEVRMVCLAEIQADEGSQARVKINTRVVRDYAAAMVQQLAEGGLRFPPVVLFTDGKDYWVVDGFHRIPAARRAGLTEIEAEVRQGTQRDALLFSISANSAHGLPRTNADQRKAVDLLLADPEWSQWSDREIARRCQVSNHVVRRRRRLQPASGTQSQVRERKVCRGGQTYGMVPRRSTRDKGSLSVDSPARIWDSVPDAPGQESPTRCPPGFPEPRAVPHSDRLGIPLQQERMSVFAGQRQFQEAKDLGLRLARLIDQIAQSPSGEVYRQELVRSLDDGRLSFACPALRVSLARLGGAEPYCCYCPRCQTAHPGQTNPRCKSCAGRGWVTRSAYDACPQHEQERLQKVAAG